MIAMDMQPQIISGVAGQKPLTGLENTMFGINPQMSPQQQQMQMQYANELRKTLPELQAIGQMNDQAAQNNAFAQLHSGTG